MAVIDPPPENESPKSRQRWEEQLEEILAAADREPSSFDKARGRVVAARYQTPGRARGTFDALRGRVSTGTLFVVFLGLVIGAYALGHVWALLGRAVAIAAVVLLILMIGRALFRPSRDPGDAKMWRGRPLDLDGPSDRSWRSRLTDRDDRP
jgi:hypothetical protein